MTVMEKLTKTVIEKLEEGVAPWKQPWNSGGTPGKNVLTDKSYRGMNWLLTIMAGYRSRYWLTFKQARELGGSVQKGQKGTPIYYFNFVENEDDNKKIPFVRYYTVFNVMQCEFPEGTLPQYVQQDLDGSRELYHIDENERMQRGDEMYEKWASKPRLTHGGSSAHYTPKLDQITMPMFEDFRTPYDYYSTLFHEMTHSTGAEHRLNRHGVANVKSYHFAPRQYGIEELVAEMGAARLCYETGFVDEKIDDNTAYIEHWMKAIKETPSILFRAANAADKAATYIMEDRIE